MLDTPRFVEYGPANLNADPRAQISDYEPVQNFGILSVRSRRERPDEIGAQYLCSYFERVLKPEQVW